MGSKISALLSALDDHGVSSDEPDGDAEAGSDVGGLRRKTQVYHIRKLAWRSNELTSVLRGLDEQYRLRRQGGRGSPPRERKRNSEHVSRRPPPLGLPRNFYDNDWLNEYKRVAPLACQELEGAMREPFQALTEIAYVLV